MINQRLIANAGSGKTHALTTRMIQLLAQGVEPRKIAALTFTRKSAGEFLSAVFERLAEAALDPDKLTELRSRDGLAALDSSKCRTLLAQLACQLGSLGMGTIDSLFARIARAFPLESGLAEDFAMAGEAEIQAARERSLSTLFATESAASLIDFIDLLRRINRSHGERDVFQKLLKLTKTLHAKFLATPETSTWGDAHQIWGQAGCAILKAGPVGPLAQQLWVAIQHEHPDLSDAAFQSWETGLLLAAHHRPSKTFSPELKKFFLKLSNERQTPDATYIPTGNGQASRVYLSPTIRPLRDELRNALAKPEFESLLQRSRSLHAIMQKFEESYASNVRSAGLVTFGDITDSLAQKAKAKNGHGEAWRTTAGYRMDQTFDHWLLDEFQDTSRPQWAVLETFIEEILMTPEQNRSFFYVGDTKQAIYSWRGGDPDLFFEIFDKYTPAIMDAAPLTQSWRSCEAILDFVNGAFEDLTPIQADLDIPMVTVKKWEKAWKENHSTSSKTREVKGYAEWVAVPKNGGDDDAAGDAPDQKILEILQVTQAWKRGLSCAVLKRDNKAVAAIAALLQSNGIAVAVEGKTNPCVDNPLGAALMAALRVCASPDDDLSVAVVRGFAPTKGWFAGEVWDFRNDTFAKLAQSGFAATIRHWIELTNLDGELFLNERASAFLLAAEEFDACRKSSDGIADFLRFVENRQTQENEATDVVRIMTIHQSKGLGFDMVIVSGLDKRGAGNDGSNLALGPEAKNVQWGVLMPAKDFAEHDATLLRQLQIQDAESKYSEICTAYVALTRPKKALYVITTELGENSKAKNFARHLMLKFLAAPHTIGNPKWYEDHEIMVADAVAVDVPREFCAPLHGTPKPVSPSSFKAQASEGSGFLTLSQEAAELGTEVHEALAGMEWMETTALQLGNLSIEAANLVRGFLKKPIAQEVFTKPEQLHDLWRERAFDVILDGQWVSGVFDRVVVHRCDEGAPLSAIIYDFKTDHGSAAEIEERYAGQMEVYRKAVCHLLSLSTDRVKSQILCVR